MSINRMKEEHAPLSFEQIYQSQKDRIRRLLYQMVGQDDVDDLVQETFSRCWLALDGFDRRSAIGSWVYQVALNVARDHWRRVKRKWWLISSDVESACPENNNEMRTVEKDLLRRALMALSFKDRYLIVMFYIEEMDIKEISLILEIPAGTVKSRLFTARKKLKNKLSQLGVSVDE